jgi:hypothetical protein
MNVRVSFFDDNEDSNDKIAKHKNKIEKRRKTNRHSSMAASIDQQAIHFDLNMNLLASQTLAEHLQMTLKAV